MRISSVLGWFPVMAAGCFLFLAAPGSANEAPVAYPKDEPAFTLEVPPGWTAEEDPSRLARVLSFTPKNPKTPYQIYLLTVLGGSEETDLGTVTRKLAESTVGGNSKITDIKYSEPVQKTSATGISSARVSANCKIEGIASYFLFTVFAPAEGHRYEVVLCATAAAKDTGTNTFDAILRSIKKIE